MFKLLFHIFVLFVLCIFFKLFYFIFFYFYLFSRATACNATALLRQKRPSVCPSVRLSVTLLYCVKTTQLRIIKSSLCDSLESLVSYEVIWCRWVRRFPSNEGIKEGYPP